MVIRQLPIVTECFELRPVPTDSLVHGLTPVKISAQNVERSTSYTQSICLISSRFINFYMISSHLGSVNQSYLEKGKKQHGVLGDSESSFQGLQNEICLTFVRGGL